jgi:hypothetical protein
VNAREVAIVLVVWYCFDLRVFCSHFLRIVILQLQAMSNYIDREVHRRSFVIQRWDLREKEKMELDHESKRKAGVSNFE